jgi:dihydroxyacid dehydratase/phosphogluconate dehydratase
MAMNGLKAIADGVDPDDVILPPERAKARGLTSTVAFPVGNIAPEGSVIKATAIDPSVVGEDSSEPFFSPSPLWGEGRGEGPRPHNT